MSYKIGSDGIFPYIKLGDYTVHIMTNLDLELDKEMDIHIVTGNVCPFTRQNIPQKDLIDLIKNGEIYGQLFNAELVTLIEQNQNKLLHFIENHDDYMRGKPYPDYESIEG
ncbi:hypothetical protein HOH11_03275 [Candidatus Woesearchaeota archaeon]|jgi:hypothetical protein|nr:hypothetical protein [Candidatus Woesearchaeota archaeon]MBT6023590.1 hypothetical protein [Candidatus Woesearchaeota archaeon]